MSLRGETSQILLTVLVRSGESPVSLPGNPPFHTTVFGKDDRKIKDAIKNEWIKYLKENGIGETERENDV